MDKNGQTDEVFVVHARPETVQSRRAAGALQSYRIKSKGRRLLSGLSTGDALVPGRGRLIESPKEIDRFVAGSYW